MVGQKRLLSDIEAQIESNNLPRFIILVGARGSGRKLVAKEIANKLGATLAVSDNKISTIREFIEQSYMLTSPMVYAIADAGNLTQASQNALLKVTEEPPNKAYWIFTVENTDQILPTLVSRGFTYTMDIYSQVELRGYLDSVTLYKEHKTDNATKSIILDIAETPGDIDLLLTQSVSEFKAYVDKVIDRIAVVSGSNSFKIGSKIAFKGEADKYDLVLFWKAFMCECLSRIQSDVKKSDTNESTIKYADGIRITSKYLQDLQIASVSKSATFDMWLLDIRESWR